MRHVARSLAQDSIFIEDLEVVAREPKGVESRVGSMSRVRFLGLNGANAYGLEHGLCPVNESFIEVLAEISLADVQDGQAKPGLYDPKDNQIQDGKMEAKSAEVLKEPW